MDFQEQIAKYLNLAYYYLSIRNRSEKEMREYLAKKNASLKIIDQIILCLIEKKFLNDESFARSWIVSRARLKPKGKVLLQMELRKKGISDEIILSVLNDVHEDVPDELTQAKELIIKRMERMVGKSRNEIYQKVGGFLARRGFSWEIVKKAIDDNLENRV
ncbi:MAG TPA: regulatory protein RecX [Candidatus Sulfotelmatobacter sp.]|jgi:regulatory protein|nr:regulatory protein RecX [Candidatus Sulfotelmatobacter sp.]